MWDTCRLQLGDEEAKDPLYNLRCLYAVWWHTEASAFHWCTIETEQRHHDQSNLWDGSHKYSEKQKTTLSLIHQKAVKPLFKPELTAPSWLTDREMSFADWLLRLQRVSPQSLKSKYLDLRYIVLTSNKCESLFSIAGFTMVDRRKGMLPSNFVSQLFYVNFALCDIKDVHQIFA